MTVTASRFLLRPMNVLDIPRVSAIERESFPTMWPQTAYRRELQRNKLAAYLVICEQTDGESASRTSAAVEPPGIVASQLVGPPVRPGFLGRLRRLFAANPEPSITDDISAPQQVVGFVGLWFMVDEAHIVTIAVAEAYRRQGLGETLLIAAVELAQHREQEVVTLECRVGNAAALALYEKYGFRRVGLRKRYYTDNNEDAAIMTTFPIRSTEFEAEFARLRGMHAARRGTPRIAHPEL